MATPRVLILRAPGTNCDQETAYAFELAGYAPEVVHLNRWLEQPALAEAYQALCIPGGFSYGDDIAAGQIVASQIRRCLRDSLEEFIARDKLVLGICNGFQVLVKSGLLLPDDEQGLPSATLTWNNSGQFEDRWVHLAVDGQRCVFLQGLDRLYLPVAHAEGKFAASTERLSDWESQGQLALRYVTPDGPADRQAFRESVGFPHNPNGAAWNVAGACDATGRVFGLMPHPERCIDPTHYPQWTRRSPLPPEGEGLALFRNAVKYFA